MWTRYMDVNDIKEIKRVAGEIHLFCKGIRLCDDPLIVRGHTLA